MNRIIRNGTARVPDVTMYRPQRAASLKGKIPVKTISAAALALGLALPALAHEAPIDTHTELVPIPAYNLPFGAASAAASLQAAEVFLASFDEATKAQFMFDLNAKEREGWSNLPARFVARAGISVGELSDDQRKLLFDFMASSLGEEGYQSVKEVMAAEAFLSGDWLLSRLMKWAPENYWISFYGTPSAVSPWGWQFGGHHLALNISVEGNRVRTMSPSFVGTEPAIFSYNGVDYEAVIDMHLAGYAVFAALDSAQKAAADAGKVPKDVLTGPGNDGVIPPAIGLSAAEMAADQKAMLLAAINQWVSIQPAENAVRRMAQIEAELDQTNFAWTGSNEVNTPTYMIIQGPTLIIELLSTGGNVGRNASGQGHYHTIYRNPTLEYGGLGRVSPVSR